MKQYLGFSLTELLVMLALILFIATQFFPSHAHLIHHTQSEIVKKQLLTALQYAKHQSQTRGETITLCPGENNQCGNNWNAGQLIFIDKKHNGIIQTSSDILFQFPKKTTFGSLTFHSALDLAYISFHPLEDENNNGTFYYILPKQTKAEWKIVISENGRARVVM